MLVLPFWCQFTQVVLEKRPLNGHTSSSSNCAAVAVKCGAADSSRHGHILMCLRDLVATNECHKSAISRLFSSPQFSHLQVPQLYKETFVGISDDDQQRRGDDETQF